MHTREWDPLCGTAPPHGTITSAHPQVPCHRTRGWSPFVVLFIQPLSKLSLPCAQQKKRERCTRPLPLTVGAAAETAPTLPHCLPPSPTRGRFMGTPTHVERCLNEFAHKQKEKRSN